MRTVGILCADGVEQVEVTAPRDTLRGAGFDVKVVGVNGGSVRGYHYIEPGDQIPADVKVGGVRPEDLDCLVVPGGLGGPDTLRKNRDAVDLVSRYASTGKPLAVICHGPWVLIEAGVVEGRELTCAGQIVTDVRNGGGRYIDADVHVDRSAEPLLVSGRDHNAVDPFAKTLLEELQKLAP
jgi:protease I